MPCASVTEAVDDIMGLIDTVWEAGPASSLNFESLIYDDAPGNRPKEADMTNGVVPWGKAFLRHSGGNQAGMGADGSRRNRWRRVGVVSVELYTPLGQGRSNMDTAIQMLLDGLEGVHTTNGVWFRNVRPAETGRDGGWYRASVLADFEYDQIK